MKEEQIDKSTDDSHMNLFVPGKTDSFTGKSFDTCAQGEVIPFNTLFVFLVMSLIKCSVKIPAKSGKKREKKPVES